jgi:hypothetical protein
MRFSLLSLIFLFFSPVEALASAVGAASAVLKDHSGAAIGLFNNMRTPAALIAGSLVPLGLLGAPTVDKDDSKRLRFMKKANIILGVTSLLSEVIAVTYSSIAINKLAEVDSPLTKGCAELIAQHYELAWIGTNIHFLLGLMGFGLIVGSKAYFSDGPALGRVTIGWAVSAFLQAIAIVNKGIARGYGSSVEGSSRFATNFFTLILRYLALVGKSAKSGFFSVAAILVGLYALYETFKVMLPEKEV